MWLDNVSQKAVDDFWQSCGEVEPFPRSLERSISLALPLTVVKLPRLKLLSIESWLQQRGIAFHFNCVSRAVRGCLVAFGGEGLIFVDGADPEDERRFTIAHELAHFIVDYRLPRETAICKFGFTITEVFDGVRTPSVRERIHSVLTSTSLGVYTNLMEREFAQVGAYSGVWEIEDRADRIALALLAPPESVLSEVDTSAAGFEERYQNIKTALQEKFGLPASIVESYGRELLVSVGRGPSWVESLGLR